MNTDRDEPTSQPIMCKNNCGFCGSPANENYCSKCYREHLKRKSQLSNTLNNNLNNNSLTTPTDLNESKSDSTLITKPLDNSNDLLNQDLEKKTEETNLESTNKSQVADKCYKCKKVVGLLGFSCRCGNTFCSQHRQANLHECQFDYKTYNRQQLERKSVKVVADKLQRI